MAAVAPFIPYILTAVGAGVSAAGAIQEGKAAKAAANYRSKVAKANQAAATFAANDALAAGRQREYQKRLEFRQIVGEARAAGAANGVDVNVGTQAQLQADTVVLGTTDALIIRDQAARESLNLSMQADAFGIDAATQKLAGKQAMKSAYWEAGSTILSAAGSVASDWFDPNSAFNQTTKKTSTIYGTAGYHGSPQYVP